MNKVKLSSLLDIRRGQSLSGNYYSESGQHKRLTLGNFDYPGGGFKENTAKKDIYFIGDVKPEFILSEGDIITPLTEQVAGLLGETATIPCSNVYIQSGDIGLVVPNEANADKRFLAHLISSPMVKKQLAAGAQQTKIRHTSPEAIKDCTVWIPETVAEQNRISTLLDLIDSEIKLNGSICADLEATAKLLYDYWFVQFDFPDENGKPYKSSGGKMVWNEELKREIPAGWSVRQISDLAKIKKGISYKSSEITDDGTPMINLASFNLDGTYKPSGIKFFSGAIDASKTVDVCDLIMCVTQQTDIDLTGKTNVIGKAILTPDLFDGQVIISTDVVKLETETADFRFWLEGLFKQPYIHKYVVGYANGTKIKHLDVHEALNFFAVCPPDGSRVLQRYSSIRVTQMGLYSTLQREIETLTETRDFFLPLLMNGQVTIGDDGK